MTYYTLIIFKFTINKGDISTKTFHMFILKTNKEILQFFVVICKKKIKDKTEMPLRQDK